MPTGDNVRKAAAPNGARGGTALTSPPPKGDGDRGGRAPELPVAVGPPAVLVLDDMFNGDWAPNARPLPLLMLPGPGPAPAARPAWDNPASKLRLTPPSRLARRRSGRADTVTPTKPSTNLGEVEEPVA